MEGYKYLFEKNTTTKKQNIIGAGAATIAT